MSELSTWQQRWAAQLPAGAERRSGQVLALSVRPGRVAAQVQGGAAAPYHVELLVDVLDDAAWQRAVDALADQARHRAALHAGRLSDELLDDLAAVDADLVAVHRLDARCPCRAGVPLCRHGAAVWHALGQRIAEDPFALMELRGRGRQQVLAALSAARRGDHAGEDEATPVADLDADRWRARPTTPERWSGGPAASAPAMEAGSLRLLGDPPGWRGPADAVATFGRMIAAGASRAIAIRDGELIDAEPRGPEPEDASPPDSEADVG